MRGQLSAGSQLGTLRSLPVHIPTKSGTSRWNRGLIVRICWNSRLSKQRNSSRHFEGTVANARPNRAVVVGLFVKASFQYQSRVQLRREDVELGSQSALTSLITTHVPHLAAERGTVLDVAWWSSLAAHCEARSFHKIINVSYEASIIHSRGRTTSGASTYRICHPPGTLDPCTSS